MSALSSMDIQSEFLLQKKQIRYKNKLQKLKLSCKSPSGLISNTNYYSKIDASFERSKWVFFGRDIVKNSDSV